MLLQGGNAGSNTAADHLQVISQALAQIPGNTRGKSVLVRIDGAGGSHQVIEALDRRRLAYSVGFTLPENTPDLLRLIPEHVWAPAYDAADQVITPEVFTELRTALESRVVGATEVQIHPGAEHGFMERPTSEANATATRLAWPQTLAFIRAAVG